MGKQFKLSDVKHLVESHQVLLSELEDAVNLDARLCQAICKAADAMVEQELRNMLRKIPVAALNSEKRGFRIKALHDKGYYTIADLFGVSLQTLSSVYGISTEGALAIRDALREITEATSRQVKIKLTLDNRSYEATNLVTALSRYSCAEAHIAKCKQLYRYACNDITNSIEALKITSSPLSWLFASSARKQQANSAYQTLYDTLHGTYAAKARSHIDALRRAKRLPTSSAWKNFSANPIPLFTLLERLRPGILGTEEMVCGLPETLAKQIQNYPSCLDGLRCTLRRYQQWGVKYILRQENVLLGDEMGLGKTIQAIAAMVALHNAGHTHFVVICPASVLTNWCREILKMCALPVIKVHGSSKKETLALWKEKGGIAITTYDTAEHFHLTDDFRFSMLVADEAHYIKNPSARRTQNTAAIARHAQRRLFMTGTALENRVGEMIHLIKLLQPSVAEMVKGMEFMSSAPQFRQLIAPVYYRRKREDVLGELPELIETKQWCSLNTDEEAAYETAILSRQYALARRVSWNIENMEASSKAARMLEIIEEAREQGRKVIVFSFFLNTLEKVRNILGQSCYGPICGAVSPQQRQEIIDKFDKAPTGAVLVAQIQAGGVGLNIQSASVVILCEPQFKPSAENQAISRAYRMGQTRNVLVHRLLCENTIDEKITALLQHKQGLFDAFADKSVAADENMEVDEKAFSVMMEEEFARIKAKHREKHTALSPNAYEQALM